MPDAWVKQQLAGLGLAPGGPADEPGAPLAGGVHVRVRGGPHAAAQGVIAMRSQIPGDLLVTEDGTGQVLSVPERYLRATGREAPSGEDPAPPPSAPPYAAELSRMELRLHRVTRRLGMSPQDQALAGLAAELGTRMGEPLPDFAAMDQIVRAMAVQARSCHGSTVIAANVAGLHAALRSAAWKARRGLPPLAPGPAPPAAGGPPPPELLGLRLRQGGRA
jgi:hypothetical protein